MENNQEKPESVESKRNWTEDYPHENGNYQCICMFCKNEFVGHKRRVVCKTCSDERGLTPQKPQEKAMTVIDYIKQARYDEDGVIIWAVNGDELQHLLDIRGWGHIQNLFAVRGQFSKASHQKAAAFQDEIGQFITDAINEKIAGQSLRARVEELEAIIRLQAQLNTNYIMENDKLKQKADKWDAMVKNNPVVDFESFIPEIQEHAIDCQSRYIHGDYPCNCKFNPHT